MIHQAKSNPQLLDEQIFSERIASAISAIGTFATCRRTPTMSVDGERSEVNGRRSKRRFYRFSEVRRWQKCDSPGQCARLFVTGSKSD